VRHFKNLSSNEVTHQQNTYFYDVILVICTHVFYISFTDIISKMQFCTRNLSAQSLIFLLLHNSMA